MTQLENPIITRTERDGPPDEPWPRCPVCGMATDTFYQDRDGDIVGCVECLNKIDAWYWEDGEWQI